MAHSEQECSGNVVASIVLVLFKRYAFAAEIVPTTKQSKKIIAKQYWNIDNHGVHAKRDHGTSYRIHQNPAWPHTVTSIYTCAFQQGCSCFTTRNYFAVVLTCPSSKVYLRSTSSFSQTHRITNGCNLFAEQPRHTTAEKNEYFVACFGQASLLWESNLRNPEPIYCLRLRDCESFTIALRY